MRTLRCADLFRVMAFAQLTRRESLRDALSATYATAVPAVQFNTVI